MYRNPCPGVRGWIGRILMCSPKYIKLVKIPENLYKSHASSLESFDALWLLSLPTALHFCHCHTILWVFIYVFCTLQYRNPEIFIYSTIFINFLQHFLIVLLSYSHLVHETMNFLLVQILQMNYLLNTKGYPVNN